MRPLRQVIDGSAGRPILLDIYYAEVPAQGIVVFLHGFKGFKDWGPFPLAALMGSRMGFHYVTFNFSYNGTTIDHPEDLIDLEAFGNNNLYIELCDAERVVHFIAHHFEQERRQGTLPFGLIGHSRGGGIALLCGCRHPLVTHIVTWAAVGRFGVHFSKEEIARWKAEGVRYELNSRTGQRLPMYYQYWEVLQQHKSTLDIGAAVAQSAKPIKVFHGTADASVPCTHAQWIKQYNPQCVSLEWVPDADHTFGGKHPWLLQELPNPLDSVLHNSLNFLRTGSTEC